MKARNEEKIKRESSDIDKYLKEAKDINGSKIVIMKTENMSIATLKEIADNIINKVGKGLVFFANVKEENVNFICRSSIGAHAGLIVKRASQLSNGNGGGSPTFAQGGGKRMDNLDDIFKTVEEEVNI